MTDKDFDAVDTTRRIRDEMYEETKGLNADELLRYFRKRSRDAVQRVEERAVRQVTTPRT